MHRTIVQHKIISIICEKKYGELARSGAVRHQCCVNAEIGRQTWWMVDLCALCSDAKWIFIFFVGGYINQLLLFICILVFFGINNFTLVNKSDMTCPMGL